MIKQFSHHDYKAALAEIGWLEALPARVRADLDAALNDAFAHVKELSSSNPSLFLALATTSFDAEMIEGAGPSNPCSYHSLVTQLAASSFGQLAVTELIDSVDWDAKRASVAFTLKDRRFRVELTCDSDWVDGKVIDFINDALAKTGAAHRFQTLPVVDQCAHLAFVPDVVWERAIERGLICEQEEVDLE